jgi:3-mercaptopyruvate sulfurtransferase SseA
MKEFAATEWQRALRTLTSAEKLVDTDPDSAASRAYEAAIILKHQGFKDVKVLDGGLEMWPYEKLQ